MAKSDLLKEAIADAKAVKETALANAKIALQEAFAPKIQNMLSAKLSEDLTEQDEEEMDMDAEAGMDDMGDAGMDDMGDEAGMDDMGQDVGDISLDTDGDGDMDFYGDIMSKDAPEGEMDMEDDMEDEAGMEDDMSDEEAEEEYMEEGDLGLDEIIAELDETMAMEDEMPEGMRPSEARTMEDEMPEGMRPSEGRGMEGHGDDHDRDEAYAMEGIDEIINEILEEGEEDEEENEDEMDAAKGGMKPADGDLAEALVALEESYKTVTHLKSVINEVNLLNAKLLYTNKLFRNFELSESQKMKVIENFDRASTTRETKLVFTTLAESFSKPTKKRVVKESYASRPSTSTAPSKEFRENTQILSEGFEHANRWKKLAGLI